MALPLSRLVPNKLPADCVLLPLTSGALLVSRTHAVFCRIPAGELEMARAVIAQAAPVVALNPTLLEALAQHGFFEPPRPPAPDRPTVQIQLTNACNLACSYCCTNSGSSRAQEIGFEELRAVVQHIPSALGPETMVALLGGEPLLVPWALPLAQEILNQHLALTIFTNGMLLAEDGLAEQMARLCAQGAKVRVSLGGPSVETCDGISGRARFEAALRGLQKLAAYGGQAQVDLMLMPQQAATIAEELPRLRARLPANTPIALGVFYLGGRETGEHLFQSRAELEEALDRVAFEAGETIPATRQATVTHRREGCACALGKHIHVRSDGALFNCFKMEEQRGALAREGFVATAQAIRNQPRPASLLPTCAACPLASLCGGGCRSENWLYTGDPDEPPCGEWRVRVICELLAEERVTAVEWPLPFLLQEARRRGIPTPDLQPQQKSRHVLET